MTVTTLQDAILDALSLAIGPLKEEYPYCRDCLRSPAGHCHDHERDYELAVVLEEAERRVRADHFGAGIILTGTQGGQS